MNADFNDALTMAIVLFGCIVGVVLVIIGYVDRRPKRGLPPKPTKRTRIQVYCDPYGSIWLEVLTRRKLWSARHTWIELSSEEARTLSEKLHLSAYRKENFGRLGAGYKDDDWKWVGRGSGPA